MIRSVRYKLFNVLKSILATYGFVLIPWKYGSVQRPLPNLEEDEEYLPDDTQQLLKMIENYKKLPAELTNSSVWSWNNGGMGSKISKQFRGDRVYVWQLKGIDIPELRYLTSTYYQLFNDTMGLLNKFKDDSLFGNNLFEIAGRKISREVLDSTNEINFLERHLKISQIAGLKVLDIGAGYGRLAHRLSEALPNLNKYYCSDGIPVSSFICDFYLRFRKVSNAEVIEMPFIMDKLKNQGIDLAINIHSFSECSLASINWWIERVKELGIRYLMIVPNAYQEGGSKLLTNKREDFSGLINKHGFRLRIKEPKYLDPLMQRLGLYPTYYYLFEK